MILSKILTPYSPRRIFVFETHDPCKEIDRLKTLALYALAVSYGIRIDTLVILYSTPMSILLNGYRLRHFHPQDKSLTRFLESILCKNKLYPGIHLLPSDIIAGFIGGAELLIVPKTLRTANMHSGIPLTRLGSIPPQTIVINTLDTPTRIENSFVFRLPVSANQLYFTIASNYILDLAYGSWVRRRGKIEWREPLRYRINGSENT